MIKNLLILIALVLTLFACTKPQKSEVRRFGQVVAIEPDKIEKFKKLHTAVWPEVLEELGKYHISNYSIFLKDLEENKPYLFGYFEYTGDNFETDRKKMLENPKVGEWESMVGNECLVQQSPDKKDVWWADMEEVFYFDGKINSGVDESNVQRIGTVIGLRPEMKDSYVLLHKYIWPEILNKIKEGNIRYYSIYLHELDSKYYLFSYFEYVGDDFNEDMALIDNDPASIAWMKFTDAGCQLPIPTRAEGEWWAVMEQVFYNK